MVFSTSIPKEEGYYWCADMEYPIAKPVYLYFNRDVPMVAGMDRCEDFSPTWYKRPVIVFGDKIEVPSVEVEKALDKTPTA